MFKKHYNNHLCSFRNKSCEKNNELYVWESEEKDINNFINRDTAMIKKVWFMYLWEVLVARADANV